MKRTDRLGLIAYFAFAAVSVALFAVAIWLAPPRKPLPPREDDDSAFPVQTVFGADGNRYATGRVEDAEAASAFRASQPEKWFGDTPAGRAWLVGAPDTVLLTDAAKQVLGSHLPARNQGQVGSCVSFGTATAIEHLMLVQISRGEAHDYHDLAQEVIYGGSRVEVGGGRIRGDGSVGAWAADFVKKWGVITRDKHGKYDLRTYSEPLCRQWGRDGVPDDLEELARESPVRGVTGIRNYAELEKAILQGYPVAVCSDQGFSTTRDKDGFARATGTWQHCMAIVGVRGGSRPGAYLLNSWGPNWITGPKGPYDVPDGGFWADKDVVDRMCRQNDTWAFSDAVGFPQRNPWFITVPRQRDVAAVRKPEWSLKP